MWISSSNNNGEHGARLLSSGRIEVRAVVGHAEDPALCTDELEHILDRGKGCILNPMRVLPLGIPGVEEGLGRAEGLSMDSV